MITVNMTSRKLLAKVVEMEGNGFGVVVVVVVVVEDVVVMFGGITETNIDMGKSGKW